jgi:hypothetical protein
MKLCCQGFGLTSGEAYWLAFAEWQFKCQEVSFMHHSCQWICFSFSKAFVLTVWMGSVRSGRGSG